MVLYNFIINKLASNFPTEEHSDKALLAGVRVRQTVNRLSGSERLVTSKRNHHLNGFHFLGPGQ